MSLKVCANCKKYTNNLGGAWAKRLCLADMSDDRIDWYCKKEPDAECHRPDDYEPIGG